MKIGLVIYGDLSTLTGGYLYDRMLVRHLRSQGDRVEIVSLPWRTYAQHMLDNISRDLVTRLKEADLDILLEDELNHPSLFWLNRRLRGRVGYRLVSIVHHLRCSELRAPWKNTLYRLVEKRYLSSVDGFIFNSRTTRDAVEGLVKSPKESVIAYPAGNQLDPEISREAIVDRCRTSGPLRLLFVGTLIRRKELHTLISAVALLPRDLWSLNVIGGWDTDPAYVREIRGMIEQEKLSGRVNLLGPVDRTEMTDLLAQSHVMAVPSSYEGYGIVYVEGMGFGLPAIASTAGAAHEIITHGIDGFLVNPGDAEQLSSHIRDLSMNRDRLAQMSLAAIDRYRAHPTWEQGGEIIRRFLKGMAS